MAITQALPDPLTHDEILAIRAVLNDAQFTSEFRKRFGASVAASEKVLGFLMKVAIIFGAVYAGLLDFLKHAAGITK